MDPEQQEQPSQDRANRPNKEFITTLVVLVAIVLIVAGAVVFAKKSAGNKDTSSQATGTSTQQGAPSSTSTTFKDGSYAGSGDYATPGGRASISINVTVKDNTVSDISAKATPTTGRDSQESEEYQAAFLSGYKQQVVGKKLSDIKLSRVSGSSLTSNGFNAALEQIKSQAQS